MKQFLIGSYAPEGEPSIFGVELDEEKQKLRLLWEDGQVQNPSFLYLHPNCHVLYAVEERVPNRRPCGYDQNRRRVAFERKAFSRKRSFLSFGNDARRAISSGQQLHGWNDWRISGEMKAE